MRCFGSPPTPEGDKSREIDKRLKADQKKKREVKILLLGPGESGKSTIFKQMKIIQDNGGFSPEELMGYKHVVYSNCISQMRVLIHAASKLKQQFEHAENIKLANQILSLPQVGNAWTPEIGQTIKTLWNDKGIQTVFKLEEKDFQLNDTAEYFFSNVDKFIKPDYSPSVQDVLRVRIRSTGIEEAEFKFDKMTFRVVDVGGQRSERRKWIHCFDCVTAVLFCTALSGYNQTLREDNTINRMEESLNLWDDVVNSTCFTKAAMILFLNKKDLFKEKIKTIPLTTCDSFKNYTGGDDYEKAVSFVEHRFKERVQNATPVFVHKTCAIDTENIEHVINDVRARVLLESMENINPALSL